MRFEFAHKQAFLLLVPATVASSIFAFPANAATFSIAKSFVEFNFDSSLNNPNDTEDPQSNTTSDDGFAFARADADTNFGSLNNALILANLGTEAEAIGGLGNNYFGYAQGLTKVLGNIALDTNQEIAFTFDGRLDLETLRETPQLEKVGASSEISFWLQDSVTGEIYDELTIWGDLPTTNFEKVDRFFDYQASNNFQLSVQPFLAFEAENQLVKANFVGAYQRSFAQDTEINLVAINRSNACVRASQEIDQCVRVPEKYSSVFGLLMIGAIALLTRVIK